MRQPSYRAGRNDHDLVGEEDVIGAIEEQIYRSSRPEVLIQEKSPASATPTAPILTAP